jgi:hypothetical protein
LAKSGPSEVRAGKGLLELALDDPGPGERSAPDFLARLTPADVRLLDPGIALVQKVRAPSC